MHLPDPIVALRARPSSIRFVVGYGAVVCALPYLALKIVWLSGGQLGVAIEAIMRDRSMVALNLATAGMDAAAIALALAFTHQWGQRIPVALLLPPMWVASGLLIRFVLAVPAVVVIDSLTSEAVVPPRVPGPVRPWVYAVVYAEFVGMGIGLMLAFVLYARTRWPSVFQFTTHAVPRGATHRVQVPLAVAGSVLAFTVGVLDLAWAFGSTIGLADELVRQRTISSYAINAIDGTMAIAGGVGILMLARRFGRRAPFWLPLVLAWIGAATLFSWGLWHLINVLGNTALVRDRGAAPLLHLVSLVRFTAGLVIGLTTVLLLAEATDVADRIGGGKLKDGR